MGLNPNEPIVATNFFELFVSMIFKIIDKIYLFFQNPLAGISDLFFS